MPATFSSSYLRELVSSRSNWYEDNYDSCRFGPQPEEQSNPIRDYLRRTGLGRVGPWSHRTKAVDELIKTHLARFEWLYNQLADNESRDILVRVLAFRALGHRKVKLPLSTPAYWEGLNQMERLAIPSDLIPVGFLNWQLHRMDLNAVGVPVQLYCTPAGAYAQFILEQYRCKSDIADIAVEPGDYVIDAGACWGDTALYFAHRSGPYGRVLGFEFVSDNLEILRRNLDLNHDLGNRIEVIERAAWEQSNLRLLAHIEGPASLVSREESSASDTGPLTLSIDDLAMHQNLPRVDFIKMDIEGAELSALRGAILTIQRHRPKLAISVYHRLTDVLDIPEFLDSLGYGYRYFLRHFTIHAEETVLFAEANR